jgi:protein-L-isoaspartate(D-aspartate) O-methyltransferase
MGDRRAEREQMVAWHLKPRGITDPALVEAMLTVPREEFLPSRNSAEAYADHPLPIGEGQTISQPYIVALTAQEGLLRPEDRVLDVGTGSGYAAAVYAHLVSEVWSVERVPALAEAAADRLARLGYDRVHVVAGDGTQGLPESAPFDAILAAAAGPSVPQAWLQQLAPGGRIVMPLERSAYGQELVRITVVEGEPVIDGLGGVRFVPLIGEQGWT